MSDPTREAPCSPESEQFSSSEYSDNRNISIPLALGKQARLDPELLIDHKIDVLITLPNGDQELLQEVSVKCWDEHEQILFSSLVSLLISCHYDVQNCRLLYFSHDMKLDVFSGYVGQQVEAFIPYSAIERNRLTLKIKPPSVIKKQPKLQEDQKEDVYIPGMNGSLPPPPILNQHSSIKPRQPTSSQESLVPSNTPPFVIPGEDSAKQQLSQSQLDYIKNILPSGALLPEANLQQEINNIGKITKRTKQRRIGDIIEKVSLWRKLYNGIPDGRGNIVRFSLEDAASKVGISKKSLDDYLLQMRFGRKFGFDFNKHRQDKVGLLRSFVRKMKVKEKESKEKRKHKSRKSSKKKEVKEEHDIKEEELTQQDVRAIDQIIEGKDKMLTEYGLMPGEFLDSQQLAAFSKSSVKSSRRKKKKHRIEGDDSSENEHPLQEFEESQPAPHKARGFFRTTTNQDESFTYSQSQEPILSHIKAAESSLYSNLNEMSSFPDLFQKKVTDSMNSFDYMKNLRAPKPSPDPSQNSIKFIHHHPEEKGTFEFAQNHGASYPHQ